MLFNMMRRGSLLLHIHIHTHTHTHTHDIAKDPSTQDDMRYTSHEVAVMVGCGHIHLNEFVMGLNLLKLAGVGGSRLLSLSFGEVGVLRLLVRLCGSRETDIIHTP
eukprot:GHVR01022751.1.p1 GENE.GHVR01022751.1~~GHVR01022751.1.p1  ORF type:complete len:106 (+),score=34.15 GHVR01022751.1:5-322(+)